MLNKSLPSLPVRKMAKSKETKKFYSKSKFGFSVITFVNETGQKFMMV